jgi:hypothetical protein
MQTKLLPLLLLLPPLQQMQQQPDCILSSSNCGSLKLPHLPAKLH